jgi:glycosyltransferase involved in cell wall biosynthesis
MKRILYVAHRYAPYPGGTENYVRNMAEETQRRGHVAAVFAGAHQGDFNGVRVSSDPQILLEPWDLIVVHGASVGTQDFVLSNAHAIPSPIMFMLILPQDIPIYDQGINNAKWIACSTIEDWDFVRAKGVESKSCQVSHGIAPQLSVGQPGFRSKHNITTPYMFLTCGGYWANKRIPQLIEIFNHVNRDDVTLVTTGYDNVYYPMPTSDNPNVRILLIDELQEVMSAISEADLYILNSSSEGFGLVLLEAMYNKTPWAATNIAGARLMADHGYTYDTPEQLLHHMQNFKPVDTTAIESAYEYVSSNHMIINTVDDILKVIHE